MVILQNRTLIELSERREQTTPTTPISKVTMVANVVFSCEEYRGEMAKCSEWKRVIYWKLDLSLASWITKCSVIV